MRLVVLTFQAYYLDERTSKCRELHISNFRPVSEELEHDALYVTRDDFHLRSFGPSLLLPLQKNKGETQDRNYHEASQNKSC